MEGQMDIEDQLHATVTARQARAVTESGGEWFVLLRGQNWYQVGCMMPDGEPRLVRGINADRPRRFASLETASFWLLQHASAGGFWVQLGAKALKQ